MGRRRREGSGEGGGEKGEGKERQRNMEGGKEGGVRGPRLHLEEKYDSLKGRTLGLGEGMIEGRKKGDARAGRLNQGRGRP